MRPLSIFLKDLDDYSETISLNFKGISTIGTDFPASKVTVLSLNYNNLKTLEGIEKFTALRKLYLNYNQIDTLQELLRIPCKDLLIELSLQGNPIMAFPNIFLDFLEKLNGAAASELIDKKTGTNPGILISDRSNVLNTKRNDIEMLKQRIKQLDFAILKQTVGSRKSKENVIINGKHKGKVSLKALSKTRVEIETILASDTYKSIMQDAEKRKKKSNGSKLIPTQKRAAVNMLIWAVQKKFQKQIKNTIDTIKARRILNVYNLRKGIQKLGRIFKTQVLRKLMQVLSEKPCVPPAENSSFSSVQAQAKPFRNRNNSCIVVPQINPRKDFKKPPIARQPSVFTRIMAAPNYLRPTKCSSTKLSISYCS